ERPPSDRADQRVEPEPALRSEDDSAGVEPGPPLADPFRPAWRGYPRFRHAIERAEPQVHLLQVHRVRREDLLARHPPLPAQHRTLVPGPFPQVPPAAGAEAAVRGWAEPDERRPAPIGGIVPSSPPRPRGIGDLVGLQPRGFHTGGRTQDT